MAQVDTMRALGAVIGSAAGDALGAPFEFKSAGLYSRTFPQPIIGGIGEMTGGGSYNWEPAEFTDDTQMALVQAESLLAQGGFDRKDLFARFRAWAERASDVGLQTDSVLSSGDALGGAEAYYGAHPDRSAGNGGLMRATPSAVFYAGRPRSDSIAAACELAGVTHGDPAAQWGAALHHGLLWHALRGVDPFAELSALLTELPAGQERYVEMLDPAWDPSDTSLPNGTVWTCLAQAVWAVRTTTTFEDALIAAIDLGGDADTVAAVTGGLAGAIHGIQAIPSRWTTYLHGSVTRPDGSTAVYDNAALQRLTSRLLGKSPGTLAELTTAKGPTEVAPGVWAADLAQAATVPTDWAVLSLCRTGGQFAQHPFRREFFLIDQVDRNPSLGHVLNDVVDTIDAFLAEGRQIVVHCHAGESRTGFVVRAWLMRHNGWDEPTARAHLEARWPHLVAWNDDFTRFLTNEFDVRRGG
jgi:ADP-ribosyl-[dinitrogen reductase] hydrolase